MKRLLLILLTLLTVFSLFSCSKYKSSYTATMLIRSSGGDDCEAKFASLNGTLVLNARVREDDPEGMIHYEAELEEGEISVYYDALGVKELLFTIKGGEHLDSRGGYVERGNKVAIIIETNGTAKNGEIEIDFD